MADFDDKHDMTVMPIERGRGGMGAAQVPKPKSRREYTGREILNALALIAAGNTIAYVSAYYGIPAGTIDSWVSRSGMPQAAKDAQHMLQVDRDGNIVPTTIQSQRNAAITQRAELSEQLYGYITDSITALRSQLTVASDPKYIQRQSARDLAVLHGVISDKATRLIAALRPVGFDEDEEEDDPEI